MDTQAPPSHIYTLNAGIEALGNSAHHNHNARDHLGRPLYDTKSFHQQQQHQVIHHHHNTLSSATDFDCVKDLDLDDNQQHPYCYKRPNGSVDLYEEVDQSRCRMFCRTWRGAIRKVTLTFTVILYATMGGIVFSYVESNEEVTHNAHVDRWRNDTAILLATELRQVKAYEDVWAKTVYNYLGIFERDLMKAYQKGYRRSSDPLRGKHWNFCGGLAFSISAMTGTVYGSTSPKSSAGKVLFPIYAVIGIPLTFYWLVIAGSILADGWTFMVLRLCCCLTRPSTPRKICPLHQPPASQQHLQLDDRQLMSSSSLRVKSAPVKVIGGSSHHLYGKNSLPRTSDRLLGLEPLPYRPERLAGPDGTLNPNGTTKKGASANGKSTSPSTNPLRRFFKCPPVDFTVPNVEYQLVIVVFAALVFVVYFVVGTAIISLRTEWTFSESLSFTVLMLTARGVGDFEPGLGENQGFAMALKQDMGMVFYYLLGMCLLSTIASLVYRAITFKKRRRPVYKK